MKNLIRSALLLLFATTLMHAAAWITNPTAYDYTRDMLDTWNVSCTGDYFYNRDEQDANFISGVKHHKWTYKTLGHEWYYSASWSQSGVKSENRYFDQHLTDSCTNCDCQSYTCQMYEPENGQQVAAFDNVAMGDFCTHYRSNHTTGRLRIKVGGDIFHQYWVKLHVDMLYLDYFDANLGYVPPTKMKINGTAADSSGNVTLYGIWGDGNDTVLNFSAVDDYYHNISYGNVAIVSWGQQ